MTPAEISTQRRLFTVHILHGVNPRIATPQLSPSSIEAGHVHPGIAVEGGWRRHRLLAFRFGNRVGVLAAFGALTGQHEEAATTDERVFAITPDGRVLDVTCPVRQVDRS